MDHNTLHLPVSPEEMLRIAHDEASIRPGRCRNGYMDVHFGANAITLTWIMDDGSSQGESWRLTHEPQWSQHITLEQAIAMGRAPWTWRNRWRRKIFHTGSS